MKKIKNIIQAVLITVLLFLAGVIILSTFNTPFKIRLFSVQSGSMEPNIHVGSLVVVLPGDSYQTGDVITVASERNSKETVTHRIVEVVEAEPGGTKYRLKGDANEDPDSELIAQRRVIGKVVLAVPYLGYPVSYTKTQVGFILLVVIPATLIVYSEAMGIKKEVIGFIKTKKNEKKQNDL